MNTRSWLVFWLERLAHLHIAVTILFPFPGNYFPDFAFENYYNACHSILVSNGHDFITTVKTTFLPQPFPRYIIGNLEVAPRFSWFISSNENFLIAKKGDSGVPTSSSPFSMLLKRAPRKVEGAAYPWLHPEALRGGAGGRETPSSLDRVAPMIPGGGLVAPTRLALDWPSSEDTAVSDWPVALSQRRVITARASTDRRTGIGQGREREGTD